MSIHRISLGITGIAFLMASCGSGNNAYDATGSFEAIERVISAEATGVIKVLAIQEGQRIGVGDTLGYIDVSDLALQAEEVKSSIKALDDRTTDAGPQILILEAQLKTQESQIATIKQQKENVEKEVLRFQKLVEAHAAPQKQLDDLVSQKLVLQKQWEGAVAQHEVLNAQIQSAQQNERLQNTAILSEEGPTERRLALIKKQMKDGIIVSDHRGTILSQMAYDGEFIARGRPLYKIANLEEITLRVYISGDQLTQVKLNQTVTVRTDDGLGGMRETSGIITWISEKAEFTPKTIQTKNERTNLVYALKVKVKNEGQFKIGMYGEISF